MAVRLWSVVFDANDSAALARFWAAALDWELNEHDGFSWIARPDGVLPRIGFVTVPNEKRTPNWMHFDLSSTSLDDQRATVERFVELGARHIDIGQGPDAEHVVLADPEGNELCVLEPGNSFVDYSSRLGTLSCEGSPATGYFWRDALGWPLVWDQDEETAIRSADGGVFFTFGGLGPPKVAKRRLHVDVAPPPDGDQAAEVERLLALGATRVDIGQGDDASWVVLADPDGNELCVLTPR
jgi:catechol 2,3-dioxygenase-like lactoylglutathione lyase family enzyme/predicted enzyme related to lactoylglutathione lyase